MMYLMMDMAIYCDEFGDRYDDGYGDGFGDGYGVHIEYPQLGRTSNLWLITTALSIELYGLNILLVFQDKYLVLLEVKELALLEVKELVRLEFEELLLFEVEELV